MMKRSENFAVFKITAFLACILLALGSLGCPDEETGCISSSDCDEGEVCDEETGECVPEEEESCISLGCPEGEVCDEATGECVPEEEESCITLGCPEDEVCDEATGECVPDLIDCENHESCPEGLVCDPVEETCYDDFRCIFDGEICDTEIIQPLAFVCRDDGTGTDRCFANCSSTLSCPEGEVCLPIDGSGSRRSCRTAGDCDGLFDDSCGEGRKCVPIWEGLPSGRTGVAGRDVLTGKFACIDIPAQPLAESAYCDAYKCDAGLICYRTAVHNLCTPMGCSSDGTGCAEGEYCLVTSMSETVGFGVCYDDICNPFGAETGCEDGEQCLIYPTMLPPHQTDFGLCIPLGTGEVGDSCSEQEPCGEGLICLIGVGCQPVCSRAALPGEPGSCAEGYGCSAFLSGETIMSTAGYCWPMECDPIEGTGCPEGEQCTLVLFEHSGHEWFGSCMPSTGEAPTGSVCADHYDCARGLCIFGRCWDLCDDAKGDSDCPDGSSCLLVWGEISPIDQRHPGICAETCTPFTGGSDCPDNLKCSPLFNDASRGVCGPLGIMGSTGLGEPCEGFWGSDCEGDLICLHDGVSFKCQKPCDREAETGQIGACSQGEVCVSFDHGGGEFSAWGFCRETCIIGDANQCESGEECLWREFLSLYGSEPTSEDICLALTFQSNCNNRNVGSICGPLSICQPPIPDLSENYTCLDVCRAETGALGLPGHPDCSDPYAVCDDVYLTGNWGFCNSNY